MLKYILKRVGSGLLMIVVISTIAFFLLILGSGNVGRTKLGENATQEQVEKYNEELGLNRPVTTQYSDWVGNAVTGDLGRSWFGSQTVADTLKQRLPVTMTLVGGSLAVAATLAIVLGMSAAVLGGGLDRLVQLLGLIGFAVPGFLIAEFLVLFFAIRLGWFNATGYTPMSASFGGWLKSVTLPILSLALASLASLSLQIRGSVRDALDLDYVRTLRSRGLAPNRVLFKHILRNAAGPALTILGLQFIGLLGGSVIVEQIFAIQGLGQVAVSGAGQGDVPLVMGLVLLTAVLVVVINLIIDLITAWLNPKVRLS